MLPPGRKHTREPGEGVRTSRPPLELRSPLRARRPALPWCRALFWPPLPVRVTISDMGPVLLSRLLGLAKVQKSVLNIVFRIADDRQMLLIDMKDLRSMLNYVSEHAKEYTTTYGNVSSQSVGAILRALIAVEDQGGDVFFGEPALELADWFACDPSGQGYVNILNAARIIQQPQIYSMFLLWMLSDLFEKLPEVGDLDKPKFVFFFDGAHLLFKDMPTELLSKIIQVVKLIRSKGVGVYFITQSPSDIPGEVLAQLSNRVQHGLRAYTPAEQKAVKAVKAVKAAAEAFRANPNFKSEDAIMELGMGEAFVSFLDDGQQALYCGEREGPAAAVPYGRRVRRGEIRCDSGAGIAHGEVRRRNRPRERLRDNPGRARAERRRRGACEGAGRVRGAEGGVCQAAGRGEEGGREGSRASAKGRGKGSGAPGKGG